MIVKFPAAGADKPSEPILIERRTYAVTPLGDVEDELQIARREKIEREGKARL